MQTSSYALNDTSPESRNTLHVPGRHAVLKGVQEIRIQVTQEKLLHEVLRGFLKVTRGASALKDLEEMEERPACLVFAAPLAKAHPFPQRWWAVVVVMHDPLQEKLDLSPDIKGQVKPMKQGANFPSGRFRSSSSQAAIVPAPLLQFSLKISRAISS